VISVNIRRWLKSEGISGNIKKPEDFIVKEILPPPFFVKYERWRNGVRDIKGPYTLLLMKKRNMTTQAAIKILSKKFGEIGYAGLKDKFAVTYQFITVRGEAKEFVTKNLEVKPIGKTNKWLNIGDLVGNKFEITLHNCKTENLPMLIQEINERGIPNYFGPQRFGESSNNHKIGKGILKGEISIYEIGKDRAKFFVHAYQSYIFNEVLNEYIKENDNPYFKSIPIVGYETRLKNNKLHKMIKSILKKEGISTKDFVVGNKMKCVGGKRKMFIKPEIGYKIISKNKVVLNFILPKGSYATVVLNELCG